MFILLWPTFGGGHDIYTCDKSNENPQSYTRYCWHYECPSGMKYSNKSQDYLAGSFRNYTLTEIEVFQIISLDTKILKDVEVGILYEMSEANDFNLFYTEDQLMVFEQRLFIKNVTI